MKLLIAGISATALAAFLLVSVLPRGQASFSDTLVSATPSASPPNGAPTAPIELRRATTSQFAGVSTSLAADIKELTSTDTPHEAYRVYAVLAECSLAKEVVNAEQLVKQAERLPGALEAAKLRQEKVCSGLTDLDTGTQRRLALLETAAAAGVPGAAVRLTNMGPLGDFNNLLTRPHDQVVLDWRKRMADLLLLAAQNRDTEALLSLANQYAEGDGVVGSADLATALKFAVAYKTLREQAGNPDVNIGRITTALSKRLPSEVAIDATKNGLDFAKSTKKRT